MKTEKYPVSSEKRTIGMAEYPVFETIEEALQHFGGGEVGTATVLKRLNAQVKTDEMNKIRSEFASGPSKEALRNKAFANLTTPDRVGELQACAGDAVKIENLLNTEIARLQAEWEASRDQRAKEAEAAAKAAEAPAAANGDSNE